MKPKRLDPIDAELRHRLRAGDPAGDGSDLTPDETGRMRRAMLREAENAPAGRPTIAWKPALALASIALVIAIGWLVFRDDEVTPRRTEQIVQTKPADDPAPSPAIEPADEPVETVPVPEETTVVAVAIEPAAPEEAVAVAEEERSARQIQFTTSNGTQIIWVLDPEFKS